MIGWTEAAHFTPRELDLLRRATILVEGIQEPEPGTFRCHEIARVIGRMLNLKVQDGFYGMGEHSWLWLSEFDPIVPPRILDPYAIGRVPMVQLVDSLWNLPHVSTPSKERNYRWLTVGENRNDIRNNVIDDILRCIG